MAAGGAVKIENSRSMQLDTPIKYLQGVGPDRAELFESRGMATIEDLLYYMPLRYENRSNFKPVSELAPGETATVVGTVTATQLYRLGRSGMQIFEVRLKDREEQSVVCKWFRSAYLQSRFEQGQTVAAYGRIDYDKYSRQLSVLHPEFEILRRDDPESKLHLGRIVPIYKTFGKVTTRMLRGMMHRALAAVPDDDPIPEPVRRRLGLPQRQAALQETHFPPADTDMRLLEARRTPGQFRLIFEEFFFLECGLALKRAKSRAAAGIAFELNDRAREKIKRILPFKPTGAQKRVLGEIAADMAAPTPMSRLLQGDVGSGKTIVAIEAAVIALENNYQVALMAPTEILATQHFLSVKKLLEPAGYVVAGLTGSRSAREKQKIKRLIGEGIAHVVVGTHAVISEDVEFKRLGLVVIDEQHRFGVLQRLELLRKGAHPDVLVMTATPIPRTLSLTFYGELDVSIIDELPPGRSPIVTRRGNIAQAAKVYDFVRKQVLAGRQAYIVYPLIDESETKTVKAAQKQFEHLSKDVFPELKLDLLHGRLPTGSKDEAMERFRLGETQILVSTTVVEVGVDVPNATVMVIEHAESFGLSQLHQLRGRVGRGAHRSYCILMTEKPTETARERIGTMTETQDGFRIAEADLQLRGPGEFFGTKQSGLPSFRVANLLRDREALETARNEAAAYVENPPSVEALAELVNYVRNKWQRRYGLIQVG